ncbi:phage/plasmid replication domain-containing protein [Rheinheimera sp.]|uniref:phage/plasmid replication domain-containing protein n=1 Tax=Rheinheimera sp. TaxID=1869214 RepID=UPI004048A319
MTFAVNAVMPTDGFFIDKLNVYQTHDADLPFIGKNGAIDFDLLTGETDDALKIKGKLPIMASYSTSIRVHCDGNRVYVEGNPSRFGRCENLFGFTSIDDCIAVYNHVLRSLGLPPFTVGRFEFLQGKDGEKQRKIYTGAVITHIDITKNHEVGMGNEYAFLRAVSTLTLPNGKLPYLYPNGATVDFNTSKSCRGSSWDYTKFYIKHIDLLDKQKHNLKDATDEDCDYYQKVIEHCQHAGLIREEHSFKSKKLQRYDLCYYGFVSVEKLVNHPTLTTLEKLTKTLEAATMDYVTIADQLLAKNIVTSRQAANATQSMAMSWLNDPRFNEKTAKTSTYYVHKKRLLALGLDISIPFRADRNVLPMIRNQREITRFSYQGAPSWYRAPTTQPRFHLIA